MLKRITDDQRAVLEYCTARATVMVDELRDGLGPEDEHLSELICLMMLAIHAEAEDTPTCRLAERLRMVRRMVKVIEL